MNRSAMRDLAIGAVVVLVTTLVFRLAGSEMPEWVADRLLTHFGFIVYIALALVFVKAVAWLFRCSRGPFASRYDHE